MSVSKYKPHVWVVPEDDANRQLANGFLLHPRLDLTAIDVRPAPGGWPKVLEAMERIHTRELRKYTLRQLILLVDFDGKGDARAAHFRAAFPSDVQGRIYVLGVRDEPESMRADLGIRFEDVGRRLADACDNDEDGLWGNEHLLHNRAELLRLSANVKPILFPSLAGSSN